MTTIIATEATSIGSALDAIAGSFNSNQRISCISASENTNGSIIIVAVKTNEIGC